MRRVRKHPETNTLPKQPLVDLLIIIVFLSIAVFSFEMFRLDLLQTFNLMNVEPVGFVVIKKNTVQRRIFNRVLWDRLAKKSPVYIGDLIRVADVSAATLYIAESSIDLDENTLIRITRSADGEGVELVLDEGAISLSTGTEDRNVSLDLNVIQAQARPKSILSAESSKTGGISIQVNQGTAQIVEADGTVREISSGTIVTMDADGTGKTVKTAVVTQPVPNARYVKTLKNPLVVDFSWNRVNLAPDERLRLEIASDRNFSRVSSVIKNLNAQAQTQFDTGLWYWRLVSEDAVLTTGKLTVADGSGPELQSPVNNSLFHYRDESPVLNFQWAEIDEADSYIIEVSNSTDFSNPQIRRQGSAVSMIIATLGEGTWYWRVMSVFPPIFKGNAVFSSASLFRIGQISVSQVENAEELSLSQWLAVQVQLTQTALVQMPPAQTPLVQAPPEEFPPELPKPPPQLTEPPKPSPPPKPPPQPKKPPKPAPQPKKPPEPAPPPKPPSQPIEPPEPPSEIISPELTQSPEPPSEIIPPELTQLPEPAPPPPEPPPIVLLPPVEYLQPVMGASFGLHDLYIQKTFVFNWSAVEGANAYIFTLYRQDSTSRRQLVREMINNGTSYTLTNLGLLSIGTFFWQVEAVNIEQRGEIIRESMFSCHSYIF